MIYYSMFCPLKTKHSLCMSRLQYMNPHTPYFAKVRSFGMYSVSAATLSILVSWIYFSTNSLNQILPLNDLNSLCTLTYSYSIQTTEILLSSKPTIKIGFISFILDVILGISGEVCAFTYSMNMKNFIYLPSLCIMFCWSKTLLWYLRLCISKIYKLG